MFSHLDDFIQQLELTVIKPIDTQKKQAQCAEISNAASFLEAALQVMCTHFCNALTT
jgi:hypothetical protein